MAIAPPSCAAPSHERLPLSGCSAAIRARAAPTPSRAADLFRAAGSRRPLPLIATPNREGAEFASVGAKSAPWRSVLKSAADGCGAINIARHSRDVVDNLLAAGAGHRIARSPNLRRFRAIPGRHLG